MELEPRKISVHRLVDFSYICLQ